jgi:copper chaperone CopZ
MNQVKFKSYEIHCDGCARGVKAALGAIQGVSSIEVDVPSQTVSIQYEEPANEAELKKAMAEAGFEVSN